MAGMRIIVSAAASAFRFPSAADEPAGYSFIVGPSPKRTSVTVAEDATRDFA